ncbi:MAG: hypothetical protein H0T79_09965 [Deltaproteobacteria bacterium]|nr:hypothetical protein [Deltaproteobacteria bacterium]
MDIFVVSALGPCGDNAKRAVASYATALPVRAISVPTPGRIVAAAGAGGIYQWQL